MKALLMGIGILANSIKGDLSMSDSTAQVVESKAVTIIDNEEVLWCPESKSVIFGTQLVSKKLVNLIRLMLLTEEDHGINMVRFTQDLPKAEVFDEQGNATGQFEDTLADYDFEGRVAVINLKHHITTAVDRITAGTKMMRLGAYLHSNLIISILHELYESHKFVDAENPYLVDPSANDAECERLAKELLVEYARTTNIEAPTLEEESPILAAFINEFEEDALTSNEDWAEIYRTLIEKNLVYKDGDTEIATLRLYYKRFIEADGEVEWPEEVVTVTEASFAGAVAETTTAVAPIAPASVSPPPAINPVVTPDIGTDGEEVIHPDTDLTAMGPVDVPVIEGMTPTVTATPTAGAAAPAAPTPAEGQVVAPVPPQTVTPPQQVNPVMPQPVGLPATGTTQAQVPAGPTLTVHNLAPQQKLAFIKDMCLRMYDYLFGYCGYQYNPQNNQAEAFPGFAEPNKVYGMLPVSDIPFAKEILVGVITVDEQTGQEIEVDIWNPQVAGWLPGHIRGLVWNKGRHTTQCPLPGYKLVLNLDGQRHVRTFAPQNCNKRYDNGNLGKWAIEARGGVMRALLLDDQRAQNDKIQITVTTYPDGSKVREVMSNPLNQSLRRIL